MVLDSVDPDGNFWSSFSNSGALESQSQYYTIDEYNGEFKPSNSSLTIVHSNICSYYANIDEFLATFGALERKPDIVILTETWLNEYNCSGANIDGYRSYHTLRDSHTGRGGGVSIFVDQNLCSVHLVKLSLSCSSIETTVISVTLSSCVFTFVAVYRPHCGTVENFVDRLCEIVCDQSLQNKKIVLLGDMNINLCLDNSRDVCAFTCELQSMGFLPTINKPTRFSYFAAGSRPSLLDHIWINFSFKYTSGILTSRITDHCPVFIHIDYKNSINDKIKVSFRDHSPSFLRLFKQSLSAVDWDSALESYSGDRVKGFCDIVGEIYCNCFPLRVKYISSKRLLKPWLTSGILKSIRTKSNNFKLFSVYKLIMHKFIF